MPDIHSLLSIKHVFQALSDFGRTATDAVIFIRVHSDSTWSKKKIEKKKKRNGIKSYAKWRAYIAMTSDVHGPHHGFYLPTVKLDSGEGGRSQLRATRMYIWYVWYNVTGTEATDFPLTYFHCTHPLPLFYHPLDSTTWYDSFEWSLLPGGRQKLN